MSRAKRNITCISRLIARRDGFTSVRGAYAGGEFTPPPVTFSGGRLMINVNTSATGPVRVGLLDENGAAIEGYAAEQCDLIHTANEIKRQVTWRGQGDVSQLGGRSVRIRFLLRNADLYAFQFAKR